MISTINTFGTYVTISRYQEQHGENISVGLSGEAESILRWARTKMEDEHRIQKLAETNVTVAAAVNALKSAEEQLKIVVTLVE